MDHLQRLMQLQQTDDTQQLQQEMALAERWRLHKDEEASEQFVAAATTREMRRRQAELRQEAQLDEVGKAQQEAQLDEIAKTLLQKIWDEDARVWQHSPISGLQKAIWQMESVEKKIQAAVAVAEHIRHASGAVSIEASPAAQGMPDGVHAQEMSGGNGRQAMQQRLHEATMATETMQRMHLQADAAALGGQAVSPSGVAGPSMAEISRFFERDARRFG